MGHDNIPNPIAARRKWLGLTQEQLAHLSGLTRQMVTDAEAGLIRKPSQSLLKALSSSEKDERHLLVEYASWVSLRRQSNEYLFREDYSVGSFTDFIESIAESLRGFCRALVIQRSLVQTYIATGGNWELIENCLWHVGLSSDYTEYLRGLPR